MTSARATTGRARVAAAALLASLAGCGDGDVPRAGDPDPTFGDAGAAIVELGAARNDVPAGVAVLPDGRILVGATSWGDRDTAFAVARTRADGSLDPSFGADGVTLTPFGPIGHARANAMAVQPDGRIVLVGEVVERAIDFGAVGFGLARYLPDGSLDPSFGDGGTVLTRPRAAAVDDLTGALFGVALQPDGRIVAVGYLFAPRPGGGVFADLVIARYHADGALDRDFGTDGLAVTDLPLDTIGYAVVVQTSGRIVAAGGLADVPANELILVGFAADGRVDPAFGDGGAVRTRAFELQDAYTMLARTADDGLVAASSAEIHRHAADGRLLPDYGGPFTAPFVASALALHGTAVLVSGPTLRTDLALPAFGLLRLRSDGRPDPTFGTRGFTRTTTRSFHTTSQRSFVAVGPDGRIVVAGVADHGGAADADVDLALARVLR